MLNYTRQKAGNEVVANCRKLAVALKPQVDKHLAVALYLGGNSRIAKAALST